ncbi:MAG: tryptophan 2,3-dioxygenase [Candidatus Obscuribacter sp.]|nr:tryptophan 2,3-dioxygenase [Candidatus Obscuribacter sp.]
MDKQTKAKDFGGITSGGHTPLTYNSYLMVDALKNLQVCQSSPAHHDEPLFIVIHQAYELWFKLIIHELDLVVELLNQNNVRRATHFMRRVVAIMKLLVQQIHILETMTPRDFLGFRDNLNPASGFQSSQFREIEFMSGLKEERMLQHFQKDEGAYKILQKRFSEPSLGDIFYALLRREYGFELPQPLPGADEQTIKEMEAVRIEELLKLYDENTAFGDLLDLAESLYRSRRANQPLAHQSRHCSGAHHRLQTRYRRLRRSRLFAQYTNQTWLPRPLESQN